MSDGALAAIERAVAAVSDPDDDARVAEAVRSVSPALVDDVVFGVASSVAGSTADGELLGVGVAASPGVGVGRVALDAVAALDAFAAGTDVVLVVDETGPADEPALRIASAVVTRRGGQASHAAIIARQWGVPAVCGIGAIEVGPGAQLLVDGATGEVRHLDAPVAPATAHRGPLRELPPAVVTLLDWADRVGNDEMIVLANADTAADVQLAIDLGVLGVGLCRTEHQFLGERAALVAEALGGAADAIAELAAIQRHELAAVVAAAGPLPLSVRLLDAPRREFDPHGHLAEPHGEVAAALRDRRGVHAALTVPGLYEGQIEALAHAVADVLVADPSAEPDVTVVVPMVSATGELAWARSLVEDAAFRVGLERGVELRLAVGVMIETPRAALDAGSLARDAESFSFGTNDLTELTYGWRRDEVDADLLAAYREHGILDRNPFETLDGSGVVRLLALAVETGRARRPDLAMTLCGEHAGDPASIGVALQLGIRRVSVSPYRVPAARLAVAQAILASGLGRTGGDD